MNSKLFSIISEAAGALTFSVMVSTGLVLEFVLPPGSGRMEMLDQGRRHQTIGVYFGLSRHEWGEIHFVVALCFLLFLAVHVIAHRKWIIAVLWGTAERPQRPQRRIIAMFGLLLIVLPLLAPFVGERQDWTRERVLEKQQTLP